MRQPLLLLGCWPIRRRSAGGEPTIWPYRFHFGCEKVEMDRQTWFELYTLANGREVPDDIDEQCEHADRTSFRSRRDDRAKLPQCAWKLSTGV